MSDYSAKMAYGPYSQISAKIGNGTLDERDIVFTSDTSELIYIDDGKNLHKMQSRIWLFDDIDSAVNTLNHKSSAYAGQPIGIRNTEGNYELYTTWMHGGTYSVKRITYATETETISTSLNEHLNDEVAHITAEERTSWNGKVDETDFSTHVDDQDIHTNAAERQSYQNHLNNDDIHITANEKDTYQNHVDNDDIHVTANDKARWNSAGITYTSVNDFIADLTNHNIGAQVHVVFPSNVISELTGNKITSPVFGLMCHTAIGRFDLTLYADGYLLYMVRINESGSVIKVSRAMLSTVS